MTAIQLGIKQPGPDDVAAMRALLTVFGEAFEDREIYDGARPSDSYIARLLGGNHFIALTAAKGDELVGGLAACDLPKFEQERSEIYVYDLAVAGPHLREGIATALIRQLEKVAVGRDTHVIFVHADQGDNPAVALYSKLGTREAVLHFDIVITR